MTETKDVEEDSGGQSTTPAVASASSVAGNYAEGIVAEMASTPSQMDTSLASTASLVIDDDVRKSPCEPPPRDDVAEDTEVRMVVLNLMGRGSS